MHCLSFSFSFLYQYFLSFRMFFENIIINQFWYNFLHKNLVFHIFLFKSSSFHCILCKFSHIHINIIWHYYVFVLRNSSNMLKFIFNWTRNYKLINWFLFFFFPPSKNTCKETFLFLFIFRRLCYNWRRYFLSRLIRNYKSNKIFPF